MCSTCEEAARGRGKKWILTKGIKAISFSMHKDFYGKLMKNKEILGRGILVQETAIKWF